MIVTRPNSLVQLHRTSAQREAQVDVPGAGFEGLRGDAGGKLGDRQALRVDVRGPGRVPPVEILRAVVVSHRRGGERRAGERAELDSRGVGAGEIGKAQHLEGQRQAAVRDAGVDLVLQRALRVAPDGGAERVRSAVAVGAIEQLDRGPHLLLEVAGRVAAVEVGEIAVVALLGPGADAVAADDLLAARVAGGAVGRIALFARVDDVVAAEVGQTLTLAADLAGRAGGAVGQRRAWAAEMGRVVAGGGAMAGIRRGAVAGRIRRDADEMAGRIAAPRAVVDAVVAFLRCGDDAVAADRGPTGPVAADLAIAAVGARGQRAGGSRAAEVCPTGRVALAGIVRIAMSITTRGVAGNAAKGAVALAACVGAVLGAEIAFLAALPHAARRSAVRRRLLRAFPARRPGTRPRMSS